MQFLEELMAGTEKTPAFIKDYKEYHTDTAGMFLATNSPDTLSHGSLQERGKGVLHSKDPFGGSDTHSPIPLQQCTSSSR